MGNKNSQIGDYEVDLTANLGDGSFGDVFLGYVKATKEKIAVKKCLMQSQDGMHVATEEIKAMDHIPKDVHIVEFYGFHFHDDAAWVFMEYCELGHLEKVMSTHVRDTETKVNVMLQCTQGLIYLHTLEHPIVHRDLKPKNVLFRNINGKLVAKLADFGLSKIMYVDTLLKTVAGTALYMAPEILSSQYYSISVDIFSLGLVFLAMVLYDSLGRLIPISATSVRNNKSVPVGREMIEANSKRQAMPIVALPCRDDEHRIRVVKRLVNKMVRYEPDERIPLTKVEMELKELRSTEESEHDSGVVTGFSPKSTLSGKEAGQSILASIMRQTLERADREEAEDSGVVEALTSLARGLQISDTLDSITQSKDFKLGDRVAVHSDRQHVKHVQKKTSGWVKSMERYIGADGWVYDVQGHDIYTVKFDDGYRYSYSGSVLEKYHGRPLPLPSDKVRFKVGEMITVTSDSTKLQKIQTRVQEFTGRMHLARGSGGVVQKNTTEGLCVVECFNGDVWKFHPDVLTKRDVTDIKLDTGDVIFISPSREFVKREMQMCDLVWRTEYEKCLDSSGTVVQVMSASVVQVKTEGLRLHLPLTVLTLYGKKENLQKPR